MQCFSMISENVQLSSRAYGVAAQGMM